MKKLYFFMLACLVSIVANAGTLYVCGNGDGLGWDPASPKEVTSDSDVYEFTITNLTALKMSTAKGDWDTFNASAIGTGQTLKANTTITLESWGEDLNMPYTGDWTLKVDLANNTLYLTTTTSAPVGYTAVYIRGGMNDWTVQSAWQLSTTDGDIYTLNCTIPAGVEFKIADASWGNINYGGHANMVPDTEYNLTLKGSNCTVAADFTGTVIFSLTNKTLRLSTGGEGGGEVYTDCTIYWDNSVANWSSVYACVTNKNGEALDDFPGNEMEATSVDGVFKYLAPAGYINVVFSDGSAANKTAEYAVKDNYIYSLTNSGSEYQAPIDYSSTYVNVCGEFNSWGDNGVNPAADGIATHTLSNVAGNFKIKVWNGSDNWYSTGGELPANTWVTINGNTDPGMTLPAELQSGDVKIEFNVATNQIRVSATSIDYSSYYVNIVGPFNSWEGTGIQPNAEGVATGTIEGINAEGFKVKVWTGSSDIWYNNGQQLTANTWIKIEGNVDTPNMTLPAELEGKTVEYSFNCATGEILIKESSAVESINVANDAEAVYYNLQGVRVANPVEGKLYIKVCGNNATKVVK